MNFSESLSILRALQERALVSGCLSQDELRAVGFAYGVLVRLNEIDKESQPKEKIAGRPIRGSGI